MGNKGINLYQIKEDVLCVKCGHKGAVQFYGSWFEHGLENAVDKCGSITKPLMEPYRKKAYMSHAVGFGGTIPWQCTNCDNSGLIDMGGLEGYKQAFISIEKARKLVVETFSKVKEVQVIAQKERIIYIYFQSLQFDRKVMNQFIRLENTLEDVLKNAVEIHYIPSVTGKLEDSIGTGFELLYVAPVK